MANSKQRKPFVPVIDKALGNGRPWFAGEDAHGPYVAVRVNAGRYQGEYFLISPQWRVRVMQQAWRISSNNVFSVICGRGNQIISLAHQIWQDFLGRQAVTHLYPARGPLDLRQDMLRVQKVPLHGYYGVVPVQACYQAYFHHGGEEVFLGYADDKIALARLYNDELRRRQVAESRKPEKARDWRIVYMKFNDVTPRFTPRKVENRKFDLAVLLEEPDDEESAAA